jgi:autotransporter-associated beta strand protein
LWSFDDNWSEGAPGGDPDAVLIFPQDALYHENLDDYDRVLPVNAIGFSGTDYILEADSAASVTLSDSIHMTSDGSNTIALDLELLYTNGTNHPFLVDNPDATLSISGRISGSPEPGNGLVKGGPGILELDNPSNNWQSPTVITGGTLSLGDDNVLPVGMRLGIVGGTGAALALNGHSATVSEFEGGGTVRLGSGGDLHLVPSDELPAATFEGDINGIGNLFVESGLIQELTGDSSFSGQTHVQESTLIVTGSLAPGAPVLVDGQGTLRGSGSVGPVTVDGILAPGGHAEGDNPTGVLHTGAVTFHDGSTFQVRLNGGTAGTGYDQLAANGAVDLSAGPLLDVSLGYTPASGDTYTLVTATGGITGIFAGLPNNSMLQMNGRSYRITYTTNSVVLTNVQFLPPLVSPAGAGPVSQAVGDFDGDGIPDLVVVSSISTEGLVSFLKGQGDGSFAAPATFSIGGQLTGVKAAQLRDNAPLDLVVSVQGDGLKVLLGNGDGTFGAPQSYLQGRNVGPWALGRFRGIDQPVDLAVTFFGDPHVYILLGNGDGTFGDPTSFDLTDNRPASIAIGDVNGDGNLDIVVSHSYVPSTVDVLLGNGDGTFQPSRHITGVGSGQFGTALADLNGDGKLDLVIANDGGSVTVLLGNGDGTFQLPHHFPVGPSVSDVQVADFDQDGIPDIVAQDSNGIAVLYGNGDGTFRSPVQYDIAGAQRQMQVADFNSDGYPDVSVLLYGGSVDVFLNAGPTGAPRRGAGNFAGASPQPEGRDGMPVSVPDPPAEFPPSNLAPALPDPSPASSAEDVELLFPAVAPDQVAWASFWVDDDPLSTTLERLIGNLTVDPVRAG